MTKNDWYTVRDLIKKLFLISNQLIDYIAVYEILDLSMCGRSNKSISNAIDTDEDYVVEVLNEFLDFPGFEEDLDFYPITLYIKSKGSFNMFETLCCTVDYYGDIELLYESCKKLVDIKKEVDRFYAKQ